MIPRLTYSLVIRAVILTGASLAAILIYSAPTLPVWGERKASHDGTETLPLPSGHSVEQTFLFENESLDYVVLWLDTSEPLPEEGSIHLSVSASTGSTSALVPFKNIPPSGTAIFPLDSPLLSPPDKIGSFSLSLSNSKQRVHLKYQIDSTKYEGGALVYHPNLRKKGDLAFQFRYQRPALFYKPLQITYALAIFLAGLIISIAIKPAGKKMQHLTRANIFKRALIPILLFFIVAAFYGFILVKPGTWVGPSDFTKELSYVVSSFEAFKSFSWPIWSHYTCGGMPLLGNPESATLSLSTLLAVVTSRPELALWLTLAIEAGLAAAGAYCLARALKISASGSILAGVITSLSSTFTYKIVEGIVMVGGPFAFFPWALLGLHKAIKSRSPGWLVLSGISLIAMFWRGDVHIIVGVILIMFIWASGVALRERRFYPLLILLAILSLFSLGATVKTLPYFEQPGLINAQVDPHSAQITESRLWDDVFLKKHDRTFKIPVLHGLPEHYGYVGSYIGIIPIIILCIGLFVRHKYRWLLLVSLFTSLVIVDGALYENVLRHLGPMSALLRMPTRLLFISVFLIAVLSGIGLDGLIRRIRKIPISSSGLKSILKSLPVIIIVFVSLNLVLSNLYILKRNMSPYSTTTISRPTSPTLTPHLNSSPDDRQHASVLLKHGYILPNVCGDQNNPPEFLSIIEGPVELSDYTTKLQPNSITLSNVPQNTEVAVRERFVSAWHSSSGKILPGSDGSIHLLTDSSPNDIISIRYTSVTIRAQQILLLTILAVIGITIINTTQMVLSMLNKRNDS
jgi:hypothetical protein